jgi:predicted transcriptional regulator
MARDQNKHSVTLALSADELRTLDEVAERIHSSRSAAARVLISAGDKALQGASMERAA